MSVRITRTGTEVVKDHNELANKGKRTHAEIDSYLQELDDAREDKPSLKDKFRELKDKNDEQDRQLDVVKSDVSTFQTGLNTLSSTVSAAEAKNQTQDLRLSQVEQKNAQQDQAILKLQSDVSSNPNAEVVAARRDRDGRTFPSLKARLDDMQGKIGTGGGGGNNGGASSSSFDLQTPINILMNTFRDAETHNRSAYRQNNMYVDVFSDSSGIDTEKSSSFGIINGTVLPGLHDTNIIMSSPTEPAPYHVSSSSETSGYPGWLGINGVLTDYYYSNGVTPPVEGHWWQIDFSIPKIITKLAIKPCRISSGQYSLASFTLQGSHDDTNWTDIYAGSHVNTDSETEHNFTNTTAYRYYRMAKLRSHRSANPVIYTGWHEIKFYEIIDAVTLVTKAVNVGRSPKKIITTAEYTDAVTFDLTLDGTTWVNNIDLNKLLDTSSLKGTNLQIRANIPATGSLKSLGFTWYDDSMLVEMPGNEGGGNDRSSTKPLVDVVAATNILRNAYRTLESTNQGASVRHNLYADAFVDSSGVDVSKSEAFQIRNGKFTKTTGVPFSWKDLGVQIASSTGDWNNSSTGFRPYKSNSTTPTYAVEKIADDNAIATPGGYTDYWLQSGTSADLFMKWVTPVQIYKIILWMNGSLGQNGHDYCDHQIFVKNPSTGKWEAVTPRINLASKTDKGVYGDGSWHYPVNLDYPINEVKVTVWNKSSYMTVTEVQILQASDENPVMFSKPIPLAKTPTHLVLDAEYEGNISIDVSLDGGTTFTAAVPLNQLVDLSTFLPGTSLVIRANPSDKAVLHSIGCIWYDEDTLPTYTDTVGGSSGGNAPGNSGTKVEVDPSLGSILLYDTIGLITANFRAAEALNLPKYTSKNLVIDPFQDDSGIDKTKSSGFIIEQGEVKRMGHNAVKGKTYNLNPIPAKDYPDNTPNSKLTDGKAGKDGSAADYLDGSWISQLGIPGSISTVDFDLTVPEIINRVKAMFCEYQISGIFFPPNLYVYGSNDNIGWTLLFNQPTGLSGNGIRKWVDFSFMNSTPYRYYRVGYSIGGTGENQKHLFVNEIELYSTGPITLYTNVESLPAEPKKMIVVAEHQGQVTYDLSVNGGNTWLNNITLDKFLEVTGGKEVCIRANLSADSTLLSLGYGWFDDSVEFIKVTPGSGNTGSTGFPMIQVNKFGVIASPNTPEEVSITIPYTSDYKLPPTEVLKFAPGEQNYTREIAAFSKNEASNFDHDSYMNLDGTLRLKTDYSIELTEDVVLPSGNSVYSFTLDVKQYSSIEKIKVN